MFKKHACYLSICLLVAPLVATADVLPVEPLPVTTPAPVELAPLQQALAQLPGVAAYPSDANFILFKVPGADRIFEGLKQRGVLIKNLNGAHPLLADCLRVTVGAPDENRQFMQALSLSLND